MQSTAARALLSPPRHERNLRGWLKRILRNEASENRRQIAKRRELAKERPSDTFSDGYSREPLPEEQLGSAEAAGELLRIFTSFPEPSQHLLLLRHIEGLTYAQIADRVGGTPKSIEHKLASLESRCREMLKSKHGQDWMVPCAIVIQTVEPWPAPAAEAGAVTGGLAKPLLVATASVATVALALPLLQSPNELEAGGAGTEASLAAAGERFASRDQRAPDREMVLDAGSRTSIGNGTQMVQDIEVVDEFGQPLADVVIAIGDGALVSDGVSRWFDSAGEILPGLEAGRTGSDGLVSLQVPVGEHSHFVALKSGRVIQSEGIYPTPELPRTLTLQAPLSGQLQGQVRNQAGAAVADLLISAHRVDGAAPSISGPTYRIRTDAQGRYVMPCLPEGTYQLHAMGPGAVAGWLDTMAIAAGTQTRDWQVEAGTPLAGRVLDASGQGVAGARVWIGSREHFTQPDPTVYAHVGVPFVVTEDDGRFTLPNTSPLQEEYLLVRSDEHPTVFRALDRAAGFAEVVLGERPRHYVVEVRHDGQPTSDAVVVMRWPGGGPRAINRGDFPAGSYPFPSRSLPFEERVDVLVVHAEGQAARYGVDLSTWTEPLTLDLEDGKPITFELLHRDDESPAAGRTVQLAYQPADDPASFTLMVTTDAAGKWLGQFPAGAFALDFLSTDYEQALDMAPVLTIQDQRPETYQAFAPGTRTARVHVTDAQGMDIAGQRVDLLDDQGRMVASGQTDAFGVVALHGCPSGEFTPSLQVMGPIDSLRALGNPITIPTRGDDLIRATIGGLHRLELGVQLADGSTLGGDAALIPKAAAEHQPFVHSLGFGAVRWTPGQPLVFEHLPPGDYQLILVGEGNRPTLSHHLSIPGSQTQRSWRPAGVELRGRLVGDATEWQGRSLELHRQWGGDRSRGLDAVSRGGAATTTVAADGRFVFPLVPAGTWQLRLSGEGLQPLEHYAFEVGVNGGFRHDLKKVPLHATAQLSLTLDSPNQLRLRDSMWQIPPDPRTLTAIHRETMHSFAFDPMGGSPLVRSDLPPGTYDLWFLGKLEHAGLVLQAGDELELPLNSR